MSQPRVAVFGSLVMDFVAWAPRRPEKGETLIGNRFERFLGGKGFNQAVAAARLGASVEMIGAVGTDGLDGAFLSALVEESIGRSHVVAIEGTTGVGLPLVTDDGDVSIVGVAGVNDLLNADHAEAAANVIEGADVCIVQCEVPTVASVRAIEIASGATTVLNAAPAGDRAAALAPLAQTVVVNEPELVTLAGLAEDPETLTELEIANAASRVKEFGRTSVVAVTLAGRGALVVDDSSAWGIDAHGVEAIDPTGAGDAFTAALAIGICSGMSTPEALEFANAAGAVAVQTPGAQPSMPRRREVESLMAGQASPRPRKL
ncbi:MAG: ribokinase [Acidobacteria bacterium]|nr:MAG: ribokinase [Acidobacteriota bacterium]